MIQRILQRLMVIVCLGLLVGVQPAWSLGLIQESSSTHLPSNKLQGINNIFKKKVACYEIFCGKPMPLRSCPFTVEMLDMKDRGGHEQGHTPETHPMVDRDKSTLEVVDGTDTDPNPLRIQSNTEFTGVTFTYPISEVSGTVGMDIVVNAPDGHRCAT